MIRNIVLVFVVAVGLACASSGAPKNGSKATPVVMTSKGYAEAARASGSNHTPMKATIEVMVDSSGRPDMTTLKVTGMGAAENRETIYRWIKSASFKPATMNGVPVAALFETTMEATIGTAVRH